MPGGSRVAAGLAALALTATLTACGATADEQDQQPPRQPSIAEQQQAVGAPGVEGYSVSIPSLGVKSSLVALGRNADGTAQVPALDQPQQVGLYHQGPCDNRPRPGRLGPCPGEKGPAVLMAHVNSGGVDGAFSRLSNLREGDTIDTSTPQGPVRFQVYRAGVMKKNDFKSAEVYSDVPGPELRLITCGGDLDSTGHNYDSNVVVWAKKV